MLATQMKCRATRSREDKLALTFLNETPIYNPDRETLRVVGIAAAGHVICRIAKPALLALEGRDGASPTQLLEIFARHRRDVERIARHKYLTGGQQKDGSILIDVELDQRLTA
jgi:hypothetical protein